MPARDDPLSAAGLVADSPSLGAQSPPRRVPVPERTWPAPDVVDVPEQRLRRRARRQALALMVASGLVSILTLYGMWRLLHAWL